MSVREVVESYESVVIHRPFLICGRSRCGAAKTVVVMTAANCVTRAMSPSPTRRRRVLDVGGMHQRMHQQALRVDEDVTLLVVRGVSVPAEALRGWRLSGAGVPQGGRSGDRGRQRRDRQTIGSGERLRRPATALGRREDIRLARPLSPAREGLGMPLTQGARLLLRKLCKST